MELKFCLTFFVELKAELAQFFGQNRCATIEYSCSELRMSVQDENNVYKFMLDEDCLTYSSIAVLRTYSRENLLPVRPSKMSSHLVVNLEEQIKVSNQHSQD